MILADVTFTSEGMLVITTLLGALVGALIALWRIVMAVQEARIRDLIDQRDRYHRLAIRSLTVLERTHRISTPDRIDTANGPPPDGDSSREPHDGDVHPSA